jgi:uncharacterized protein HemX
MDSNKILKRTGINNILLVIAILVSIGFFFYGMINNIIAEKDKELAIQETQKRLACEEHSLSLMKQLQEKEMQLTQARAEAALLKEQVREKRNK